MTTPTSSSHAFGDSDTELIGNSAAIQHLRTQLRRIGPYFRRALLAGETGTGKELAARLLHRYAPNAGGPFVSCDAATASTVLIEQAGATRITPVRGDDPDCLLSAAQGGTLYLAGICEMSLVAQGHLLQVLQRYERQRKGMVAHPLETRIIASARRDLRVLTAAGRFRQELYHRLAMVEIDLPPLRNRIDDLAAIAEDRLAKLAAQCSRPSCKLSGDALHQLRQYAWPGNLRELENVLRSAMLTNGGGVIETWHLPELAAHAQTLQRIASPATDTLQEVIDQHVMLVLQSCAGNKVRAAERLGISRSTLYRMLDSSLEVVV